MMFILYPLIAAIVVGLLTGGRLARLGGLQIRLWWLALAGLAAQVVLFSPMLADIGEVGPLLYMASSASVLAVVWLNRTMPGAWLILLGGAANQVAIAANGGYMPTSAAALAAAGLEPLTGYSNSVELADPALVWLTDIFAMPAWLPFANVFSLGDLLIGLGVGWLAFRGMGSPVTSWEGTDGSTAPEGPGQDGRGIGVRLDAPYGAGTGDVRRGR